MPKHNYTTAEQRTQQRRQRAVLNTALEHLYQSYRTLATLAISDDICVGRPERTRLETIRLRNRVYDLWLDGALLMSDLQATMTPEIVETMTTEERR